MKKIINKIRPIPEKTDVKREVVITSFIMLFGFAIGLASKFADGVPISDESGISAFVNKGIHVFADISTDLGIWVFILTLIVAFSRTPVMAMINTPLFLLSMLAAYYLYGYFVLGFFPESYFFGWLIISLLSPIGGLIVWFSRGKGWVANICAALPVFVLITEGHTAYYTYNFVQILDIVFAVILLFVIPQTWRERAIVLAISCIFAIGVTQLNLLAYLPLGGYAL